MIIELIIIFILLIIFIYKTNKKYYESVKKPLYKNTLTGALSRDRINEKTKKKKK
tara:strand:+ start:508 stop:672 length:165 start_codon:yes stop_codon:yes gene_type:complete